MSEFLTRVLFEDLVLLLIAEVVLVAIVLAVHRRRYTARTRKSIGVAIGLCIILIGLQGLIKTDRERIKEQVAVMAHAVDEGDMEALGQAIDGDFADGVWDRDGFLRDYAGQILQQVQIDEAKVGGFQIELKGDKGVVSFRAVCDYRRGNDVQRGVPSFWKLEFVRRGDVWKMRRILSSKIGPGGLFGHQDVPR